MHLQPRALQAAELRGRFRCVLADLQGQGQSPEGSARGNMLEHHATDCLAIVSALKLKGKPSGSAVRAGLRTAGRIKFN